MSSEIRRIIAREDPAVTRRSEIEARTATRITAIPVDQRTERQQAQLDQIGRTWDAEHRTAEIDAAWDARTS